jgi:hypothetical protein
MSDDILIHMTAKKRGGRSLHGMIKSKVINGVAVGKSDASILTDIPTISESSVYKIKKDYASIIEAKKRKYIKLIDKFTGGDISQARKLAQLQNAEKDIYNFQGEKVGSRPDHKIQLETVKYLDKLKGRENPATVSNTQNNLIINEALNKYTK